MRNMDCTASSRRMSSTHATPRNHSLIGGLADWALSLQDIDQRTRHIALLLSLHVNANGEAFPSVERLAELSGMTPRTVQSRLDVLLQLGILSDTGRKAGRRGSTRVLRVSNYRPATWQKQPAPAPATTAEVLTTPAETLTTPAVREQANNRTPLTKGEPAKTKPSELVKERLAAIKRGERITPTPSHTPQACAVHLSFAVRQPGSGSAAHVLSALQPVLRPARR